MNGYHLNYRTEDYWGNLIHEGEEVYSVPGDSSLTKIIKLDIQKFGYFKTLFYAKYESNIIESKEFRFAIIEPIDPKQIEDSWFGVQTHFVRPDWPIEILDIISKLGIKYIRENPIYLIRYNMSVE